MRGRPLRLRPGARVEPHDPEATLGDPRLVRRAMLEAFEEGDLESVVTVYKAHLRVLKRKEAAQALGISRQAVHKALRTPEPPSLRTLAAFMRHLNQHAA